MRPLFLPRSRAGEDEAAQQEAAYQIQLGPAESLDRAVAVDAEAEGGEAEAVGGMAEAGLQQGMVLAEVPRLPHLTAHSEGNLNNAEDPHHYHVDLDLVFHFIN
jgi:hypothetical protein